jgi:fido (protein-threonine AMPylation protein)
MAPLEAYVEYEEIHPFVDSNGRTGKIILNYLNGTLLDPIFPPNDIWGDWISNP